MTECPFQATVKKLQQDVEWTVTCDRLEHNPDGTQKRKRGRPKGSKDKQARKKRQKRTEANAPQAGFSAGAV
jgi:hypothetical protein